MEGSVFAIVKISYNNIGETSVTGGICGTGFLINDSTLITSNHVLNKNNYLPNPRFKHVQYWLLKRQDKKIIELSINDIHSFPDIETSIIHLKNKVPCDIMLSSQNVTLQDAVFSYGHIISYMPITKAHWNKKLVIDDYNLEQSKSDKSGLIIDINRVSVSSNDNKINNKLLYKPDFIANMGMSGGPLFKANQLIGLMSFGLPADSFIKKEVYAISANEIISVLNPKNSAQH